MISFVGKLDDISWERKEAVWWCLTLKKWSRQLNLASEFLVPCSNNILQHHIQNQSHQPTTLSAIIVASG